MLFFVQLFATIFLFSIEKNFPRFNLWIIKESNKVKKSKKGEKNDYWRCFEGFNLSGADATFFLWNLN